MRFLDKKKYLFLIYGLINVFLTNLIIQTLLFIVHPVFSTFLGQTFNFLFGFFFYGKNVFQVKYFRKSHILKYLSLNIIIWNINWITISSISLLGFSKNIIALIIIVPLALISYTFQKYFVFVS